VRATWSDGKCEDVTASAQYDSLNDSVASVKPDGLVTGHSLGETYVMVRFAGQAAIVQVTLPYARVSEEEIHSRTGFAGQNFIDDKLVAKWRDLGLTPSPLSDDATFFRRIHVDGLGTLPEPADVRAFLADRDPDKRRKAIYRVLGSPEFVDYWALKWG